MVLTHCHIIPIPTRSMALGLPHPFRKQQPRRGVLTSANSDTTGKQKAAGPGTGDSTEDGSQSRRSFNICVLSICLHWMWEGWGRCISLMFYICLKYRQKKDCVLQKFYLKCRAMSAAHYGPFLWKGLGNSRCLRRTTLSLEQHSWANIQYINRY